MKIYKIYVGKISKGGQYMEDYGIIVVRATTASGAYPVPGVNVIISGTSGIGSDVRFS